MISSLNLVEWLDWFDYIEFHLITSSIYGIRIEKYNLSYKDHTSKLDFTMIIWFLCFRLLIRTMKSSFQWISNLMYEPLQVSMCKVRWLLNDVDIGNHSLEYITKVLFNPLVARHIINIDWCMYLEINTINAYVMINSHCFNHLPLTFQFPPLGWSLALGLFPLSYNQWGCIIAPTHYIFPIFLPPCLYPSPLNHAYIHHQVLHHLPKKGSLLHCLRSSRW